MTLSPQWLDELRSRITLSTLVGRTVKITKAGREYKGCCPFHNENTPSFYVNDDKAFYHCFGCGAHGDAIRWMTDHQGLGFMDAVKDLAAEAGMTVPAPDPKAAAKAEARATLHDVMAAAQDWFVAQLGSIQGTAAREYLQSRGFTPATQLAAGFGFAPDSRTALKSALSSFDTTQLVEAGLLIAVEDKTPYDRFRGRLMIPIRDPRGRVIAFGGRILGEGEPKYLNSPDTPLFDKGRTLYNIDKASPASRQTGRVIVVEGYMDAIALAQAGFADVVAPLGTALTETQIELLWKMTETPLLCFDGDSAGQKAAMRGAARALPMLRPGHSLKFVSLPKGLDPDDLIRKSGPKAFADVLEKAEPMLEYLWRYEAARLPLNTPEEKAGLKARLMAHAQTISDGEVRSLYTRDLSEIFSATFYARKAREPFVRGNSKGKWQPAKPQPGRPMAGTLKLENESKDRDLCAAVLAGLLRYPACIRPNFEALAGYRPPNADHAAVLRALLSASMADAPLDTENLLTILQQQDLYDAAKILQRADNIHFSFNRTLSRQELGSEKLDAARKSHRDENATADLNEAIILLTARPEIEAALELATKKFKAELEDQFFIEQQRLRVRKQEFDRRLAELSERGATL